MIVIKYRVVSVLPGMGGAICYAVVKAGRSKSGDPEVAFYQAPKWCAKEVIRQHGLVIAQDSKEGTIWDTPDMDFFREWKGRIHIPDNLGSDDLEEPVEKSYARKIYSRMFSLEL